MTTTQTKQTQKISGIAATMMVMAKNAAGEEVHVALPNEKRAVEALEKRGLVVVRRTTERCAGHIEWWYRLAA